MESEKLPAGMQGLSLLPDLLPDLLSRRYVDQFKSEMNKLNGVIGESDQVARRIHSWPFGEFSIAFMHGHSANSGLHSCMAIRRILHCIHAWPFGEFSIARIVTSLDAGAREAEEGVRDGRKRTRHPRHAGRPFSHGVSRS